MDNDARTPINVSSKMNSLFSPCCGLHQTTADFPVPPPARHKTMIIAFFSSGVIVAVSSTWSPLFQPNSALLCVCVYWVCLHNSCVGRGGAAALDVCISLADHEWAAVMGRGMWYSYLPLRIPFCIHEWRVQGLRREVVRDNVLNCCGTYLGGRKRRAFL